MDRTTERRAHMRLGHTHTLEASAATTPRRAMHACARRTGEATCAGDQGERTCDCGRRRLQCERACPLL
eukprot:6176055-Pleurochrysis_carterae.AAC.1